MFEILGWVAAALVFNLFVIFILLVVKMTKDWFLKKSGGTQ
jgi:hypothetical protein